MKDILDKLGLDDLNPGTWLGAESSEDEAGSIIESFNPANGELIGKVRSTTPAEYERVIAAAQESFIKWRTIPAPIRRTALPRTGAGMRSASISTPSAVS